MFFYYCYVYFFVSLMRKLSYILCVAFACAMIWTTSASSMVDSFIASIQAKQAPMSFTEKKDYYRKTLTSLALQAVKSRNNAEQLNTITALENYITTQLNALKPTSWLTFSIPNVDLARVRTIWLSLHTTERAKYSLTPFVYSPSLESTASVWANYLASQKNVTHQRKSTDGYYSYTSIKQRFLDQWIVFATKEKNGQALFTENLWRGYYTCKKTDCTDDFIKAITTTRTFFMNEKGKSYKPHYNAIVGNYQNIGLGVALVGNTYYLVSHYTQTLK